ncbi:MAG TPA: alpha/beta hydrolase [Steroidobacteraceae bacterium]|nr:alpha/beta hydrolase [Steroidobacteraceae bacterium]
MARYFPPPEAYRPGLILQLRERPEGGGLLAEVLQVPLSDLAPRTDMIVLVHGFNNHYGEAATAYFGFRSRQRERDPACANSLESKLGDAFWPGDAAWGIADKADFLVYSSAVGTAIEAAEILASHLAQMPTLRRVNFLGHSLGCRVVLETVRLLASNHGPHVGNVCLMAAAVPLFKVVRGGELEAAMDHADQVLILYSEADTVLKWAFPAGQTLARGDEGFCPRALGRREPPPTIAGRSTKSKQVNGARHGDYWGHSETVPARSSIAFVSEFFSLGALSRSVDSREVGEANTFEARPSSSKRRGAASVRRI